MPAALIDQCAALLDDRSADIATLASPIASQADFEDPNVVKVVVDNNGNAIYFSRAAIPYARGERQLVEAEPSELEVCERLEQLRALALGMTIRVGRPSVRPGSGVDTEADLSEAAKALA